VLKNEAELNLGNRVNFFQKRLNATSSKIGWSFNERIFNIALSSFPIYLKDMEDVKLKIYFKKFEFFQ